MKRAFAVVCVLTLSLVPTYGGHSSPVLAAGATEGPPAGSFTPGARAALEDIGLRTRTSRTYEQDGHFVAHISANSMNYKDSAGDWQPIDNTLVASSVPGFAQENKANRYRLLLPQNIGNGPVKFQLGADWIQFQPVGQTAAGNVSANKDSFTTSDATFSYQAQSDGVKESIALPSTAAPSSYTFNLETSPGLTARQNGSGGIDFVDTAGTVQFSFAPPFAQDAAGAVGPVSMTLASAHGNQTVTVSANVAWLVGSGRQYPVVIDPTISIGDPNTTADCWIQPTTTWMYPNTGSCDGMILNVSGPAKALVQFDLSAIPSQAELLDATLGLSPQNSGGPTMMVGLYAMTHSWTSGVNWATYDGTHAWTTAGGDYSSTMSSSNTVGVVGTSPACPNYECQWGVTALAQGWLNGTTPNYGVAVRDLSGATTVSDNPQQFIGSRFGTSAPQLTVTYTSWTGDRRQFTETSQSLSDQLDVGANVANGNLLLHEHDTSIPGTGLDLSVDHYYNNLSTTSGSFGNGWTMSTAPDVGLQIYSDGSVALQGPTGYQVPFIKGADGSFSPPSGIDSTLVLNGDGTYTLTEHASSETYKFTAGGFLTAHTDSSGNTIAFGYTNNLLSSITDTQGRRVSFTYQRVEKGLLPDQCGERWCARTYSSRASAHAAGGSDGRVRRRDAQRSARECSASPSSRRQPPLHVLSRRDDHPFDIHVGQSPKTELAEPVPLLRLGKERLNPHPPLPHRLLER